MEGEEAEGGYEPLGSRCRPDEGRAGESGVFLVVGPLAVGLLQFEAAWPKEGMVCSSTLLIGVEVGLENFSEERYGRLSRRVIILTRGLGISSGETGR